MLIQHNPNEGLKLKYRYIGGDTFIVLIQHNPNEGLKQVPGHSSVPTPQVLIQHNPNEGLKHLIDDYLEQLLRRAHSAQPERGIETPYLFTHSVTPASAHSAQPERGIETR